MKKWRILASAILLLFASLASAQEYRDIGWSGGVVNHWFPTRGILQQTTGEVVEFFDAEGKPLERITGIFAYNNRLYVYDSATGHAYLYSADRLYLAQLTNPRHPISPKSGSSGSNDGYGTVISADMNGRVLLATGSGMHLIDGTQYALHGSVRYTRGATLFDDTIVSLRTPYSIPGDPSFRISTFSLLGGKIERPWANIPIDQADYSLATDGKYLVVFSYYPRVKIAGKDGSVKTIIFDDMLAPAFISGKPTIQKLPDSRRRYMPNIWNTQLYRDRIYLFLFSNYGHHFICEYDLEGTMLRAWQVNRPQNNQSFVNAMTIVFVNDIPQIYAYREPWGEAPSPGEITLYTPIAKTDENAEAVQ